MATDWSDDEQRRFLSTLYEEAAQPDDSPEDVAERVASLVRGPSRRDILKGGGALGIGALLGGGGMGALTGDAQAAASTSDSDGDVGLPGDRVDVYGDGVDANSVDTDSGTIGGDPILGGPTTSQDTSLTLGGGWTTIDADHPAIVSIRIKAETDGTSLGSVAVNVDNSGGTTSDLVPVQATAQDELGSGSKITAAGQFYVPAGGSVKIDNAADPAGGNSLAEDHKYIISS